MSVIFLFIDGVGLGEEDENNPFHQNLHAAFVEMAGGQAFSKRSEEIHETRHLFTPVDARLGVKGLPQSGTGQAALFSGENAPGIIGKHFGPFPHSGIKHLLREQSLFRKVQRLGRSCHFINAYPEVYFTKAEQKERWSCTTLMAKHANLSLNTTEDVINERAVTAGITQRAWREKLGLEVPVIKPEEAAGRVLNIAEEKDFVLSEYYLTDKAGHSRDAGKAFHVLQVYSRFLLQLMRWKREEDTLVLSSDHGNLEDLSTQTHTLNDVPLFVYGPGAPLFSDAGSIMDVTPGILEIFQKGPD